MAVPVAVTMAVPAAVTVSVTMSVTMAVTMDPLPASASEPAFVPTLENRDRAPGRAPEGMVWIPGGEFSMGAEDLTPVRDAVSLPMPESARDSRPIHRVYVDGFWMDRTEVTNSQFQKFVEATGYKTVAQIAPTADEFPETPKENLKAGSSVFTPASYTVPLNNMYRWWRYQHGADWRHPEGPDSTIEGRDNYPVVQIAYSDALAYAKWAGKRLPTEAEWEFAARGGKSGAIFPWGNELMPSGKWMANIYQGKFPMRDDGEDGFVGIAPVSQFPPNAYGLFDMAGNVWEWCSDWYRADYYSQLARVGDKVVRNPHGPESAWDPVEPREKKRVHRGGSFLCTDQYCTRYMVGTRGKGEVQTAANHLGFRCVKQ